MSMLFFFKPIYHVIRGVLDLPAEKPKKKKKVYQVTYDRKTPTAKEVDYSAYHKALFRVDQRKQEKQEREDLLFLTAMLEGAL